VLYNLNSPSARGRIEKLFPGRKRTFYEWVDFVLLLVFGTLISFFGYQPGDAIRGIFAGASAVAVLRQFVLKTTAEQPIEKGASQ